MSAHHRPCPALGVWAPPSRITANPTLTCNSHRSPPQATAVAPRSKADFGAFQPGLVEGAVLLRRLATRALLALLRGTGLDADAVLEECVAESPTAASTSVLNVYNYFNRGDSGKSEANDGQPISANCPAHTDPGLVTVLARGTADGLQIATGRTSDAACCSGTAAYHVDGVDGESVAPDDVEWVTMEPLMRADQVGVLVGESLRRLTGGALPACLHRVVSNGSHCERSNVIYELRPAGNVFHPWENGAHDKVSAASKAPS